MACVKEKVEDECMSIFTVLIITIISFSVCVAVKLVTKRMLDDQDGVKGLSTKGAIKAAKARSN